MGFKIGRSGDAPVLETRKTARYGEQKVVATETPVEPQEEKVEEPAEEVNGLTADLVTVDESPVSPVAVVEKKPAKAKRGRKPKK